MVKIRVELFNCLSQVHLDDCKGLRVLALEQQRRPLKRVQRVHNVSGQASHDPLSARGELGQSEHLFKQQRIDIHPAPTSDTQGTTYVGARGSSNPFNET
ncbi:hypothetical protein AAFF_G00157410 [Aldrovandia affinis]|uniref:Uncharacterized protein n=1 Tax=Aldrovandia affinis TaxID=143900 RepID=A0AAD7RNC6_9TELE|nr:hypothetical protein AAFF_G00157410 [Aldrovandia affinis]